MKWLRYNFVWWGEIRNWIFYRIKKLVYNIIIMCSCVFLVRKVICIWYFVFVSVINDFVKVLLSGNYYYFIFGNNVFLVWGLV